MAERAKLALADVNVLVHILSISVIGAALQCVRQQNCNAAAL